MLVCQSCQCRRLLRALTLGGIATLQVAGRQLSRDLFEMEWSKVGTWRLSAGLAAEAAIEELALTMSPGVCLLICVQVAGSLQKMSSLLTRPAAVAEMLACVEAVQLAAQKAKVMRRSRRCLLCTGPASPLCQGSIRCCLSACILHGAAHST